MMPGRVGVVVAVRRRVRVRMVLHLAGPCGGGRTVVVLGRHLAPGARATRGVTPGAAPHAPQVSRRRAARHRAPATCNMRQEVLSLVIHVRSTPFLCPEGQEGDDEGCVGGGRVGGGVGWWPHDFLCEITRFQVSDRAACSAPRLHYSSGANQYGVGAIASGRFRVTFFANPTHFMQRYFK
jgi:hypothetical protein